MKHVFLFNNNINKKIAKGYVAFVDIPGSDVIYVSTRKGDEISSISFFSDRKVKFVKSKSFFEFFLSLLRFKFFSESYINRKINDLVSGERFKLYIPHAYSSKFTIFSSHELCDGVFIVEEGDASYGKDRFIDPLNHAKYMNRRHYSFLMSIFNAGHRFPKLEFFPSDEAVDGSISLSNEAFCFYRNNIVVPQEYVFTVNKAYFGKPEFLFLIDNLVKGKRIGRDVYLNALRNFLMDFVCVYSGGDVSVSFHPTMRREKEFIRDVIEIFEGRGLVVDVFEGDVEEYIYSVDSVSLVAIASSSLRYASVIGVKAYSWLGYIDQKLWPNDISFESYYESSGTVFLEPDFVTDSSKV